MREYKISESTIKKRMRFTLVFASIIFFVCLIASALGELTNGMKLNEVLILNFITVLVLTLAVWIGLKLGRGRLRATRLILEEDYIVWYSPQNTSFSVKYSDVKEVKFVKNKGIILKIKKSFGKKYIPYLVDNLEEAFEQIEIKVCKCE